MAKTLSEILRDNFDAQEAIRKARVIVEGAADPNVRGRTAYRLTGLVKEDVQRRIGDFMEHAENSPLGGFANFVGPHRLGDGTYGAVGEVILYQPEAVS